MVEYRIIIICEYVNIYEGGDKKLCKNNPKILMSPEPILGSLIRRVFTISEILKKVVENGV